MIKLLAPAKVNLGLEIIGRRADGYHEIRTIYCAVSQFDRLTIASARADSVNCDRSFDPVENLATRALSLARCAVSGLPHVAVSIAKRIPSAAGLGGASSDAAATLIGLNAIAGGKIEPDSLSEIASAVGSDVPFLLEAGLATGSGRGEVLTRIPFRTLHMVLIAPKVEVPDKTREMYARVQAADYSSGRRIIALEKLLGGGAFDIPAELLHNGFRRPLYDLVPEVRMLALAVESITGRPAHITGAGPAHFVLCRNMADALDTRHRIAGAIQPSVASLTAVRSVPHVLTSDSIDG